MKCRKPNPKAADLVERGKEVDLRNQSSQGSRRTYPPFVRLWFSAQARMAVLGLDLVKRKKGGGGTREGEKAKRSNCGHGAPAVSECGAISWCSKRENWSVWKAIRTFLRLTFPRAFGFSIQTGLSIQYNHGGGTCFFWNHGSDERGLGHRGTSYWAIIPSHSWTLARGG
jgi:hypothetical protein